MLEPLRDCHERSRRQGGAGRPRGCRSGPFICACDSSPISPQLGRLYPLAGLARLTSEKRQVMGSLQIECPSRHLDEVPIRVEPKTCRIDKLSFRFMKQGRTRPRPVSVQDRAAHPVTLAASHQIFFYFIENKLVALGVCVSWYRLINNIKPIKRNCLCRLFCTSNRLALIVVFIYYDIIISNIVFKLFIGRVCSFKICPSKRQEPPKINLGEP